MLLVASLPAGLAVFGGLVCTGLFESLWVRRRVDLAIDLTTRDVEVAENTSANPKARGDQRSRGRAAFEPYFPPSWLRRKRGVNLPAGAAVKKWETLTPEDVASTELSPADADA